MKRIILASMILLSSTLAFSQSAELTPIFGYTISGDVDGYYGYYDVKDDISYGGLLSVEVDYLTYIELGYLRTDTRLKGYRYLGGSTSDFNIGVEHYQVGTLREFKEGKVAPFGKANLGATRYVQTSEGNLTYWLFSVGFGLGAKVNLNERIGLRLMTNLMLPLEFAGGGIFCGIGTGGSGCSSSVAFNVPLVHWDLGLGVIIKLPR